MSRGAHTTTYILQMCSSAPPSQFIQVRDVPTGRTHVRLRKFELPTCLRGCDLGNRRGHAIAWESWFNFNPGRFPDRGGVRLDVGGARLCRLRVSSPSASIVCPPRAAALLQYRGQIGTSFSPMVYDSPCKISDPDLPVPPSDAPFHTACIRGASMERRHPGHR